MGLPRKGTRDIVVDGRRYRWNAAYADITWCSAACPLRLAAQREGGRGQMLLARFEGEARIDGVDWVFPRYGSEVTPGVVADVIRAGLAAGWVPEATGRPPVELDGEPFLRLPEDPSKPPPGSDDDLKRRFLTALRERLLAATADRCEGCGRLRESTPVGECPLCGSPPPPSSQESPSADL